MTPEFKTGHLYLAGYLVGKDFPLLRHEQENNYVSFFFVDTLTLQRTVEEFYQNFGLIRPQDFIHGIESMRTILKEQRREA